MKLRSIISSARSRELKKLSNKDITDEIIVGYINLALIAIYSRFQLRTEELIINLRSGKTMYKLDGTDPDVFRDGVLFSSDDVMNVIKAFDEEKELSINKDNDPLSIYTISYNRIQVPFASTGEHIGLIYRAAPEYIVYTDDGNGNAEEAQVDLPMHMMEALLSHIGYSAYSSIDVDNQVETNMYLSRFDRACNMLEVYGLTPQDTLDLDIDRKGFL